MHCKHNVIHSNLIHVYTPTSTDHTILAKVDYTHSLSLPHKQKHTHTHTSTRCTFHCEASFRLLAGREEGDSSGFGLADSEASVEFIPLRLVGFGF